MNPRPERLAEALSRARAIAVVGLSGHPGRASHRIASYLQAAGYRIIPVNPNVEEALGERAHRRLTDIEERVDIVNVFRRKEAIPRVAEDALRMRRRPALFWMQDGLAHPESARRLEEAGIETVQDMCIKTAHARLLVNRPGG